MRWAGWCAVAFCSLACGGAPPSSSPGTGGGGIQGPDGGIPDAGSSPDCAGLVPAGPGGAVSFDLPANPGDVCTGSGVDGQGVVAAGAQPAARPRRWFEYPAPYGSSQGNFESPEVFPQPKGFLGLFVDGSSQATLVAFDSGGGIAEGSTPTQLGAASSVVLGRSLDSGAISLSAGLSALVVRKHGADASEVASATVPGSFTPRAVAEDASGAILAVTASGSAVSGFWVDLSKNTAGQPFSIGSANAAALRPLLGGGVAVQLDGAWAGTIQPGQTALHAPPSWLGSAADLVPIRGGTAYALIRPGGSIGIVSAQGSSCGSLTFPGVSSVSIGLDGSAVGSTGPAGCTKFFWRNVLH